MLLHLSLFVRPVLAVLRPSVAPVDLEYRKLPWTLDKKGHRPTGSLALWVGGQDSGIRLPLEWRVWAEKNRRGDIAGFAVLGFSGAYTGQCVRTFVRPKGGRTVMVPVPRPERFGNLVFRGLDEAGRVLALAVQGFSGPMLDDPFYGVSHAYLWTKGSLDDLGPAQTAAWTKRGTVAGVYWVDQEARPINGMATETKRTLRRYEWEDGQREESVVFR